MKSPKIRFRLWSIGILATLMLLLAVGMVILIKPVMGAPGDIWLLYSYEDGTQGWAPDGSAGSVAASSQHATDGLGSLEITSTGGHFEGRPSGTDVDWTGWGSLVLDIYSPISTTTHLAFKTGTGWTWQQSPDYQLITGTNTLTITFGVDITLSTPSDVRSLLVFYPAGVFYQDNIRLVGYTPPPPTLTPTLTPTLGPTPTPLVNLPGLRVMGSDIYDNCGEKILLRGVNKMVTWTDPDGDSFPEIAKTGANSVRIVWLPEDDPADLDAVIQTAIDNGLIPMVGLWNTTGDWGELTIALEYWLRPDVIEVIQKYEQFLLVNIGNEAGDASITAEQFKDTYRYIILRLRDAGVHTPLVIDGSDWGKDINVLQAAGPYLEAVDPEHNVIFDVHTYWPLKWGWSDERVDAELAEFAALDIPLIIGEFGNKWDNDGSVGDEIPYQLLIQRAYEYGFGVYPWEWGPGNNPQTHLNMTDDSTYDTLHDWGLEVAITSTYSILNTSNRPYSLLNGGNCESGATATPGPSPTPYNDVPEVEIVAPDFQSMFDVPANVVVEADAVARTGSVSKVEFYANGVKMGEASTAPYTTTWQVAITGEYWLTAKVTDNVGAVAWSDGQYVIVGVPAHFSINNTITTNISDTLSDLNKFYYDGSWNLGLSPDTGRFHDDDQYSTEEGASFEISFHGTQIELYSSLAPHHGIAGVVLDGDVYTGVVDLHSPISVSDALVWTSEELELGDHTLVVTVTGESSVMTPTGYTVTVDRVRITTGETDEYQELMLPIIYKNSTVVSPQPTATAKPPTPTMQATNTLIVPTRTAWPTSTPTTPVPTTPACVPLADETVYDDSTTWGNWSWGSTLSDLNNTVITNTGTSAISVTIGTDWDGFSLHRPTAITETEGISSISFYIYGGSEVGQNLQFYTQDSANVDSSSKVPLVITNTWTLVEIPLSALGNPEEIQRITIQKMAGGTANAFYIDDVVINGTDCDTSVVLFSFEDGVQGWLGAGTAGTVTVTTTHATAGTQALQINSAGGWFESQFIPPQDFTGKTLLKFDVYMPSAQTIKVAFHTGPWNWHETTDIAVPAGASTFVVDLTADFGGPLADMNDVNKINIYFNTGTFVIDNVRVE